MIRKSEMIDKALMKRMLGVVIALAAMLVILQMSCTSVNAESTEVTGTAHFDGKKIESSFSKDEFARVVSNLQPGDDVTFRVTYTNDYKDSTDWYMENTVEQTLEKTTAAKKVTGTGTAEGGGYTYKLTHIDKNGAVDVLFSNANVGGDKKAAKMEGLEQATNALEDYFFIESLGQGETGTIELHVAFDGETEVNDYMDTDGGLNVRFAVEIKPDGNNPGEPGNPGDSGHPGRTVKTGDSNNMIMWTGIALTAGFLLMALFILSRRKDKKEGGRAR